MAKRAKKRATNNDGQKLPDFDIMGEGHTKQRLEVGHAFTYAAVMFSVKECKGHAVLYANEHLPYISLSSAPDWEFKHIGACCWILSNGGWFENWGKVSKRLIAISEKYKKIKENKAQPKAKVIDPGDPKTDQVLGDLDEILDACVMRKKNITNPREIYDANKGYNGDAIRAYYQAQIDDIEKGGEGYKDNPDVPLVLKVLGLFLSQLSGAEKDQLAEKKKARATAPTRKPRKINPPKMVQSLKYMKAETDLYNIKSIQPVKIVEASALWVFNTKTRKISHFVAHDRTGLLVQGTTIKNFNQEKSIEKTLRKPALFFAALEGAGKVAQRTLLTTVNGKGKSPTGRINEHCVLIKVY